MTTNIETVHDTAGTTLAPEKATTCEGRPKRDSKQVGMVPNYKARQPSTRGFIEDFRNAIRAAGLVPPDEIVADGTLHRFSSSGKRGDDAGYYTLFPDGVPAGHFGCWRSDVSANWCANIGRELSAAERDANRQRMAEARAQREAEAARRHAAAAATALEIWKAAVPSGADHPYLARKGVQPVETLRELPATDLARLAGYAPRAGVEPLQGRVLVAPVKVGRSLSTVELIDEDGRKSALAGGKKAGGLWAAQPLPDGDGKGVCILVGEGVATVLSARQATGHLAVAALSAGQLLRAARAMRERYPAAGIVLLADLPKDSGDPDHRAAKAAHAVGGALAVPDFGASREANDTDFNDLAARCGADAVRACIASAHQAINASPEPQQLIDRIEPEPQPLIGRVEPEPYPLDALPAGIQAAVREVQAFVKAPVPLVASTTLAVLSMAAQALIDVQRAERLQGPAGLFLLTIGDSGERKTTCEGFFTAAIQEFEAQQADASKPEIQRYKAALSAWQAKREGILSAIKDAAKKGKPTGELDASLADLEHDKPEPPRVPKLLYGDATPEALTYELASRWPSGAVLSSEAGQVLGSHGMGGDSIMRNLSALNLLWDGKELVFTRRTSESYTVRGARLTVALQVQEATLREFFAKSGALARGIGFFARFLVAWPKSTQGTRMFSDAPPSWPALAAFNRRIAALLAEPVSIDEDGVLGPRVVGFTSESRRDWIEFHDAIESKLGQGGELFSVRDVASKTADNAARLAALFHVYEGGTGGISRDAFAGAARIAAWHLNESLRFFGELALPPELADAVRIDEFLIEQCRRGSCSEIPRRELQRAGPVRDATRLTNALQVLIELGRVRVLAEGKRKLVRVTPALLQQAAQ